VQALGAASVRWRAGLLANKSQLAADWWCCWPKIM